MKKKKRFFEDSATVLDIVHRRRMNKNAIHQLRANDPSPAGKFIFPLAENYFTIQLIFLLGEADNYELLIEINYLYFNLFSSFVSILELQENVSRPFRGAKIFV